MADTSPVLNLIFNPEVTTVLAAAERGLVGAWKLGATFERVVLADQKQMRLGGGRIAAADFARNGRLALAAYFDWKGGTGNDIGTAQGGYHEGPTNEFTERQFCIFEGYLKMADALRRGDDCCVARIEGVNSLKDTVCGVRAVRVISGERIFEIPLQVNKGEADHIAQVDGENQLILYWNNYARTYESAPYGSLRIWDREHPDAAEKKKG
ncbi:MAG: hypothetical protein KGZ25_05760 [Planctomycetes bacterium]|nr:hypothetical protein [Planctomycetota bacterium]